MKKNKLKIISTKSLNPETLYKASLNDIEIDELPFILTEPVKDDGLKTKLKGFLQQNITAVFTSKNAVAAFEQIVNAELPWKIFCIGQSTKKAVAKLFGEEKITGTAEDAATLAGVILQDPEVKKVYFFCGKQRREELPGKLKEAGVELEEITVYETRETPQKISRKNYDGILFFSPSAVKSFFSMNKLTDQIQVFTVGKTTANEVLKYSDRDLIVSDTPSEENMIALVIANLSASKTA